MRVGGDRDNLLRYAGLAVFGGAAATLGSMLVHYLWERRGPQAAHAKLMGEEGLGQAYQLLGQVRVDLGDVSGRVSALEGRVGALERRQSAYQSDYQSAYRQAPAPPPLPQGAPARAPAPPLPVRAAIEPDGEVDIIMGRFAALEYD